jgi:hypothetical protein
MSTIDRRGATVSAADPPIGTNPNPDLAWKAPVRTATTGNINLQTIGLATLDGIALAAGDRVLVKDQTDKTTNGLYNAQTGPWTRTIDANNNSQFSQGLQVIVTQGAQNGNVIFGLTTSNPITLGTSLLTFATFATIGLGLPSTLRVVTTPGSLVVNANDQIIEIEAAVTSITLPSSKNGPVTIIDALGNFGANNCAVTVSGGATISGMSSEKLTMSYTTRTYRQLANGNYVIQ